MVADFVCDDISLCEFAGRTKTLFKVAVKSQIDVNFLVGRAVEGPHRGLSAAAGGGRHPRKEHKFRFAVLCAMCAEHLVPRCFGTGQHLGNKSGHGIVAGRSVCRRALALLRRDVCGKVQDDGRINPEEITCREGGHNGSDAQTATADPAATPAVFNVVAQILIVEAHVSRCWRQVGVRRLRAPAFAADARSCHH